MKKIIRIVLVIGVVFGAGYYFDELKQAFQTMSPEDVAERAREGKQDIRKEFLEAKSRFLNGKAEILDGEYEKARTELKQTLRHLQKTMTMRGTKASQELLPGVMDNITHIRQSLADGRKVAGDTLQEAQEKLDALLDRVE